MAGLVVELLPEPADALDRSITATSPSSPVDLDMHPAAAPPPASSSTRKTRRPLATPPPPPRPPISPAKPSRRPILPLKPLRPLKTPIRLSTRGLHGSHSTMASKAPGAILSESEYEALPPSIQRKYFSSLERLRIAEHAAQQKVKARPLARFPGPILITHTTSTASGTDRRPRAWNQPGKPRQRKSHSLRRDCTISHVEAQWFLSLPDKVRRQQFSREEQVLLAGGLDTYLPDSADYQNQKRSSSLIDRDSVLDLERDSHFFSEKSGGPTRRSSSPSLHRHHQITGGNDPFEIVPSTLTTEMTTTVPDTLPQKAGPSPMRRTLSATTVPFSPFRQSTSSSIPSAQSSSGSRKPMLHTRAQSSAMQSPIFDTSRNSVEAPAKHYQDPDARQKLKLYLGTPQKFDEAIEFGFPSAHIDTINTDTKKLQSPLPVGRASRDLQTFLRGDIVSCMGSQQGDHSDVASAHSREDEEETEGTEADPDSPLTPSDTAPIQFRHGHRSNFSSFDSSGLPPAWPNLKPFPQDPHKDLLTGNREMTLRMTLTRPDLRANEEELYGWKRPTEKDPLALEELPTFTDDVTGSHSPFAPSHSRRISIVGRLMGKIKKRNH